jgi:hypothetical protein
MLEGKNNEESMVRLDRFLRSIRYTGLPGTFARLERNLEIEPN